ALLAHHCEEGGLAENAVDYWLAAGRQAQARSTVAEAVARLHRGLALAATLPDSDRRREAEFDLQIALRTAMLVIGGIAAPEAGEAYARARRLSATLERPRALLSALWGQFMYEWARGDFGRARQLANEMGAWGEDSSDVPARVIGCTCSAMTDWQLGEFNAARAYVEKGLALYDPAHRPYYRGLLPIDMLVNLLDVSIHPLICLGHLDQALSRGDAALAEARRLSHSLTLVDTLAWTVQAAWCLGSEHASILPRADQLMALSAER